MFPHNPPSAQFIADWAAGRENIRAGLLTSTRAVSGAATDVFSDFDVILVVCDARPYYESRAWLDDFGALLALYRDPLMEQDGFQHAGYVVQYEDGLKIDFSVWPVGLFQRIAAARELPAELDAGYQVLFDKDGLTAALKPPTLRGYIPRPPSAAEFGALLESFFVDAIYTAKYLWRGDLAAAKYILDSMIKQEYLIPLLTWHFECEKGWAIRPGPYGRGLGSHARPDLWAEFLALYCAAGLEENWQALERTLAFMRKAGGETAQRLGFEYPADLQRRVEAFIARMRAVEKPPRGG